MDKKGLIDYWLSSTLIKDKKVLAAFKKVKRERFVLKGFVKDAYEDKPLPILAGQTISQPTTVMLMLQALEVNPGMNVLEIGAGSGYNAALLSVLVGKEGKVHTTEIIPALANFAKYNLKNFKNVAVHKCDGSNGLEEYAPYDRIVCTAAAPEIPKPLISQLKDKGIIIIPVGEYTQKMVKGIKKGNRLETISLGDFMFVPLKGEFGK